MPPDMNPITHLEKQCINIIAFPRLKRKQNVEFFWGG